MSLSIHFRNAKLAGMTLAKVGNAHQKEPLQTSKTLCHFRDSDADLLTHCFLKPFRSLELHSLHHHSDLSQNEVFSYAAAIFDDNNSLLENGALIARHLYSQSHHPNIKAGDLCVALVNEIQAAGETVQGLCLIKSESQVPFLQISVSEGDLKLTTQQGIYPDKIDKGCLIVNCNRAGGFSVYVFDKGGGNTHFWNREFLGAAPVKDDDYLTRRYSELCVAFAEKGLPEETRQEERLEVAKKAIDYISENEDFDLAEFQNVALVDPGLIESFTDFKTNYEEERGQELEENFTVSKTEAQKAKKRLKSMLKLDTGVQMRFASGFIDQSDLFLERGFDQDKQMQFVKVYYHKEV